MLSPTDEQPAIVVRGVRKQFAVRGWLGRPRAVVEALQGADLQVEPGDVHGVMGPNGSGKSTLLRILATLVTADAGDARVRGLDVGHDAHAVRGQVGFSAGDERSLYWRLTARQNLEFAAALYHLVDTAAAVDRALRLVDLLDDAERPVSGFSQGMIRRLGLARAVLHAPRVLLLDEPTRSLDPIARSHFQHVLSTLRDDHGVTTLITTHDQGEAVVVCNRLSFLSHGTFVDHIEPIDEHAIDAVLRRLEP